MNEVNGTKHAPAGRTFVPVVRTNARVSESAPFIVASERNQCEFTPHTYHVLFHHRRFEFLFARGKHLTQATYDWVGHGRKVSPNGDDRVPQS